MVLAAEMLSAEREARDARRGLWAHQAYAVLEAGDTDMLNRLAGTFQIVRGRITALERHTDRCRLVFGDEDRRAFAVVIPHESWTFFRPGGMTPQALVNREVEARGWLARRPGLEIEVTHPAAIEIMDPGPPGDTTSTGGPSRTSDMSWTLSAHLVISPP